MRRYLLFIICFTVLCLPFLAEAQEPSSKEIVQAIEVRGHRIISPEAILTRMKTKTGGVFSQDILDEDLKRLYATGFFLDVRIDLESFQEGLKIVVVVSEKPVIEKIHFEGGRVFKTKKLLELADIKEKEFLDRSRLRRAVVTIAREYEKKGFPNTEITYDVKMHDESAAEVIFQIDEGKKVKIKKLLLEGNRAFTDKRLKKLIKTKEDGWFRSGVLKEEVLQEDLERLSAFYKSEGYLDVVVEEHREFDSSGKKAFLQLTIYEGKRYLVGEILLRGTMIYPESDIRESLTMVENGGFSREGLRRDIANIQKFYFDRGYINAEINADTALDEATGRVDVRYSIVENELTYIREIHVKGNLKTRDVVIRRELRVLPGEPFDGEKLKRSRERLFNLGFFEEVTFDTVPTTVSNQNDLVVEVNERKTGEFSFGGGFSSIDRFIGFVEVGQRNFDWRNPPTFVGDGQDLVIKGSFGDTRQDYVVSWTEPWIFNKPISFGFDLYRNTRERSGTSGYSYDQRRTGGDLRLGKAFGEFNRADIKYTLEEVKISNVQPGASAALLAEVGVNTLSSMELRLKRDTRDNIFSPSKGYTVTGSVEVAGGPLGADRDFFKYQLSGTHLFTVFREGHVFSLGGRAGLVHEYDDTAFVPIFERFFAGGANTVRGYQERDIGPRDPASGDPVGGVGLLVGQAEYVFPIVEILKGAIFFDVGSVTPKTSEFGQRDFHAGTGVGVRVKTPIGPVSIDFGYPINPDRQQDDSGQLHFNISRSF